MAFCPAGVHPVQHLGPVLRLGSAGPCVEGQNSIFAIIFPGQQGGQAYLRHAGLQQFRIGSRFLIYTFIPGFFRQFNQRQGILIKRLQLLVGLYAGFQLRGALQHLLAVFHIIPKAGFCRFAFQLGNLDSQFINVEGLLQFPKLRFHALQLQAQFFKLQHNSLTFPYNKIYRFISFVTICNFYIIFALRISRSLLS